MLPAMVRDRQQRREALPAVGRREDQSPLCGFASLRLCVNKKKNVSPQCCGTGSKEIY